MLNRLHKENLKLQKAFCNLYCCLTDRNNNALKNGDVFQEKRKWKNIISHFKAKVMQLQKELHTSKERYELLEFCFLELEHKVKSGNIENVVDRGINTELSAAVLNRSKSQLTILSTQSSTYVENYDVFVCHCCLQTQMMDNDQCRKKLDESRQKLNVLCKQLDVVSESGSEKRDWRCIHEIVSSVEELQSLIAWIIEKKGTKEDSSVISQKLQKLNRIRKVLEKSAYESQKHLWPLINQSTQQEFVKSIKHNETKASPVKRKVVNFCLPYDNESLPDTKSENVFDLTDSSTEEILYDNSEVTKSFTWPNDKNTKVYISEPYSAFHAISKPRTSRDIEDQPDSMCTAISEDEGLGEESRRGDSTGPNSLLEISDSIPDLPFDFTLPPEVFSDDTSDFSQDRHIWTGDSGNHRNSIELCLVTIAKLKTALSGKENELMKLKSSKTAEEEITRLKTLVDALQCEIRKLRDKLSASEKENETLKEQVLELEEAENDARFKGQHLQEKLVFLQEKDSHFQAELTEAKQSLELCIDELSIKDSEERELQSQLKYMEVLVQTYEDQTKKLEESERALKETVKQMEEKQKIMVQSLNSRNLKYNDETGDVSSLMPICDNFEHNGHITNNICAGDSSYILEPSVVDCHYEYQKIAIPLEFRSAFNDVAIQTETSDAVPSESTYTSYISCDNHESLNKDSALVLNCPVQQELLKRLHHLAEEDADLQRQLHYVDQINLALWQRLHEIQFHIGECQKETLSENPQSPTISPLISLAITDIPDQSNPNTNEMLLKCSALLNSEITDEKLKDKLNHLESINSSFLEQLDIREKLCVENNQKHEKWIQTENKLSEELESLKVEKESMLKHVAQLNVEKLHLAAAVDALENELEASKQKNSKEVTEVMVERDAILADMQSKINLLLSREKNYMKQITKLQGQKRKGEENKEFENLKVSYIELQLELERCRDEMDKMRQDFEVQLGSLQEKHSFDEKRLFEALESLRQKDNECKEKLNAAELKEKATESALIAKQKELDDERTQFKVAMQEAEEKHKLVETELRRKLFEMEEGTAVATQALTEERLKLEKELQGSIDDLRSKEATYKTRIRELESNVSQLHTELHRITGNLRFKNENEETYSLTNFQRERLLKELQELRVRESELKEKLEEMEKKEAAYKETLEHADRIMASVERGYKNKIEELELSERSLKQKVGYLEEVENDLRMALQRERRSIDGRKPEEILIELSEAEKRENSLKDDVVRLEQSQRSAAQKVKDLEKIREDLESQLSDREDLVISLEKIKKEQETTKKELLKVKKSENSFQLALEQTESLLKMREAAIDVEMQRYANEKKGLEETINQLRSQVREFTYQFERHRGEEEIESEEEHMCHCSTDDTSHLYRTTLTHDYGSNNHVNSQSSEHIDALNSADISKTSEPNSMDPGNVDELRSSIPTVLVNGDHHSWHTKDIENCECCDTQRNESNSMQKRNVVLSTCSNEMEKSPEFCSDGEETPKVNEIGTLNIPEENASEEPTETTMQDQVKSVPSSFSSEISNVDSDYHKVRMHLEQCMLRAMDAMKMEMEQKEPSKKRENSSKDEVLHSPLNFHVVQQVGSDTVLVCWEYLPTSSLVGFEVYVNGQLYESVLTPDRRKAVIGGLDLNQNLTLSIYAVSSSGQMSEPQTICLTSGLKSNCGIFFREEDDDDDFYDDFSVKEIRSYSMNW